MTKEKFSKEVFVKEVFTPEYFGVLLDYIINLPLTTSIGENATFSRASTATLIDNEGLIQEAQIGEVRFEGARRVENLARHSEDLSDSYYGKFRVIVEGTNKLVATGDTDPIVQSQFIDFDEEVTQITASANIWTDVGQPTDMRFFVLCYDSSGSLLGAPNDEIIISLSQERKSINKDCPVGTRKIKYRFDLTQNPTAGDYIYIDKIQVENTSGQVNQNPSEYVSVDVLPTPYHGANVDGVKYLTTENGNTVLNNVVIEGVGADIPEATLQGYLSEPEATNFMLYSNDFTIWGENQVVVTANESISLDGGNNMSLITEANTTPRKSIYKIINKSGDQSFSIYAKEGTRRYIIVGLWHLNTYDYYTVTIDLRDGAITQELNLGTFTNTSVTVEYCQNGIYRINVSGNNDVRYRALGISDTPTYTPEVRGMKEYQGDGTSGLYVYEGQIENGLFSTSIIHTEASTVTRIKDLLSTQDDNFPTKNISIEMEITPVTDLVNILDSSILFFNTKDSRGNAYRLRTIGSASYGFAINANGLYAKIQNSDFLKDVTKKFRVEYKYVSAGVTDGKIFIDDVEVAHDPALAVELDHSNLKTINIGSDGILVCSANFKNLKIK